jgi:hypothetical protein
MLSQVVTSLLLTPMPTKRELRIKRIRDYQGKHFGSREYLLVYQAFDPRLRDKSRVWNIRYKLAGKRAPTGNDDWWIDSMERIHRTHSYHTKHFLP